MRRAAYIVVVMLILLLPSLQMSLADTPDIIFGDEYIFNSSSTYYTSVDVLDDTHIILGYQDHGNSDYGTVCMGTISGDTITFGDEYVFSETYTQPVIVSAIDSAHFIVAYARSIDGGGISAVKIGTISGDTITFGDEYVFCSEPSWISMDILNSTHFVVAYGNPDFQAVRVGVISDNTIYFGDEYTFSSSPGVAVIAVTSLDSNHIVVARKGPSEEGIAVVGTVSGTSITFGEETFFHNYTAYGIKVEDIFSIDALDNSHVIITYDVPGDVISGTCKIGTVYGDTITFGSPYEFDPYNSTISADISVLDSAHFVVSYGIVTSIYGGDYYGKAKCGTVSGDTISFGSAVTFNSGETHLSSCALDSTHFVIAYSDGDNGEYGTAVIGTKMMPVLARFSYTPTNPQPNEPVYFIDQSRGNIVTWIWDFGDGTTEDGRNPTHVYNSEGNYTVTLRVIDTNNNFDTTQKTITVKKLSANPFIPKPQKPTFPRGYTIKEMCDLLRISNLPRTTNKVRVVFIDSGISSRNYQVNNMVVDLSKIMCYTVTGDTEDEYGHGTAVGSILLYILATKVDNYELICIKAFDQNGLSTERTFIEAMELAKKLHPDIVSISAGSVPSEEDIISRKAEDLIHDGIVVVASAGNYGSDLNTILSPAINPYVIAVGAEDPEKTILNLRDDTICEWSSRGSPSLKKPNCVAPGESIHLPWGKIGEKTVSGTSFSAPFVAGGIAVAISKNRGLYDLVKTLYFWDGTIVTNAVKSAVEEMCYPKGVYYVWGAGIPQFDKLPGVLYEKLMVLLLRLLASAGIVFLVAYLFVRKFAKR